MFRTIGVKSYGLNDLRQLVRMKDELGRMKEEEDWQPDYLTTRLCEVGCVAVFGDEGVDETVDAHGDGAVAAADNQFERDDDEEEAK